MDIRALPPRPIAASQDDASVVTDLKPRLELRLGISGHRPPRLREAEVARIRAQLCDLLGAIRRELALVQQECANHFSDEPARLILVSPLASGADSIAAQAALDVGAEIDVCLPFPPERYRQDFDAEEQIVFEGLFARARRVLSLPGEALGANEAYAAVGTLTLAQSDVLIAVWDGQPAGGQGGTSDVIAEAVADHTPVLIIDANGELEPRLLWSGTDPEPHDSPTMETLSPVDVDAVLDQLVRALTAPPPGDGGGLDSFFADPAPTAIRPIGYPLLQAITGARKWSAAFSLSTPEQSAEQLRPMLEAFAPGTASAAAVEQIMLPRFAAADMAANLFAVKYRGGFISNFVMSALCVFLALTGLLAPNLKIFLLMAELFLILVIVLRTRTASRAQWHRRWIDTRHLAELLRILTLSSALGNLSLRRRGDAAEPHGWPGWYARATARELGMPPVHLSADYIALTRDQALRMIGEQRAYHANNAHRMEKIDHWLRHVGESLFVVTIIACVIGLFTKLMHMHFEPAGVPLISIVTFLSAVLPAVGAALYGIRMQGDFAAAAERSLAIGRQLDRLKMAIERDSIDNRRLAGRLFRLADIMLSEIDKWRQMSEVRPLELPG